MGRDDHLAARKKWSASGNKRPKRLFWGTGVLKRISENWEGSSKSFLWDCSANGTTFALTNNVALYLISNERIMEWHPSLPKISVNLLEIPCALVIVSALPPLFPVSKLAFISSHFLCFLLPQQKNDQKTFETFETTSFNFFPSSFLEFPSPSAQWPFFGGYFLKSPPLAKSSEFYPGTCDSHRGTAAVRQYE